MMRHHGPYTLAVVMVVLASASATTGFADGSDEQQRSPDSQAGVIRRSLGKPVDFHGDPTGVDLNGDGVVNILDAGLFRLGTDRSRQVRRLDGPELAALQSERVIVEPQSSVVISGSSLSVLFLIRDNTTPLAGYTLDATVAGEPGTMGTVTANVAATCGNDDFASSRQQKSHRSYRWRGDLPD